MNRVRIFALSAAAMGVAVAAATQFDGLQNAGDTAPPIADQFALNEEATLGSERPSLMQAGALPVAAGDPADPFAGVQSDMTREQAQTLLNGVALPEADGTGGASLAEMARAADVDLAELNRQSVARVEAAQQAGTGAQPPLSNAAVLTPPETALAPQAAAPDLQPIPRILEGAARADVSEPPFGAPVPIADATLDGLLGGDTEPMPLDDTLEAELNACAIWLVVTPSVGAMLDASVYAPCDGGAVVEISHGGLTIDSTLGQDGQLLLQIPALAQDAQVDLLFADGRTANDRTLVPDLADIDRVALQWTAPISVALHAYEFGAGFGEPGHIHAGNPQGPGNPGRGFLTLLGDLERPDARVAQVYSYPRGQSPQTGQVALEIEVPVTQNSCGQTLQAHAFELYGGNSGQVRAINMDLPACDNSGGYVVLPGVLPDLQIALN